MKIVFCNRFFHPDTSATSQMLSDLAFHLADKGHEVHVVTSRAAGDAVQETLRGVQVHRVAGATSGPHSLAARALAYVAYYRGARQAVSRLARAGDLVVAKTDPPMLSAALARIVERRGAHLVVWLQDLFPEVARQYGIAGMQGPLFDWLRARRNASLAVAQAVVAISEGMRDRIAAEPGIDARRLHVIHNWADAGALAAPADGAASLRRAWGLEGKFVVAYSGNLGRVHEFDTLLGCARALRDREDIAFVFIGRGPRLAEVQRAAGGMANVQFRPHLPRERLAEGLALGDVHVIVLDPAFESLVLPSKLYGVLAAARPTLFIGSVTAETARLLGRADAGVSVATGDAPGAAAALLRLKDDAGERARLGANARRAAKGSYDLPIALAQWEAVLGVS